MDPKQFQYAPDMVTNLVALCRATFGNYFHTYKEGMPSVPLTDLDYPACIVQKMKGNYSIDATETDKKKEVLVIMLFSNKADNVGGPEDPGITTLRELQNLVEGETISQTSPGYYNYAPGTLLYAIRTQLTLSNSVINSMAETSYDVEPRVDEQGKPTIGIASAVIMMNAEAKVIVPGRT